MKQEKSAFFEARRIITARFVERPNRFLVQCIAEDVGDITAFLPNPGRLWELLLPGAKLYLQRDDVKGSLTTRKTKYTVLAVERDSHPVFLHTHATNQVAGHLIERGLVPSLRGARIVRPEVRMGKSRFDFLLDHRGSEVYMEVKSCTLFGNNVAMFPDAVTERGRKHLVELAELGKSGTRCVVLFVIHYPNVKWFMPDYHTDFDFSETLLQVRENLAIIPAAVEWRKDLSLGDQVKVVKIPWDYLKKEVKDRGSYLLVLRLAGEKTLNVGQMKKVRFRKGYYVYVGSAMGQLSARIARHRRKRKTSYWHIDYLTQWADDLLALPVRSSERLECKMAEALCSLMKPGPTGFGSSDCQCATHLFWSGTNPIQQSAFHEMLQSFRMRAH